MKPRFSGVNDWNLFETPKFDHPLPLRKSESGRCSRPVSIALLLDNQTSSSPEPICQSIPAMCTQALCAAKELRLRNRSIRLVGPDDPFEEYDFILAFSFERIDKDLASRLAKFVEDGGIVAVTARTGILNRGTALGRQFMRSLFGIDVVTFVTLEVGQMNIRSGHGHFRVGNCYEVIDCLDAEVLCSWGGFRNRVEGVSDAAVTCRDHGFGRALYIGTCICAENVSPLLDIILNRDVRLAGPTVPRRGSVPIQS